MKPSRKKIAPRKRLLFDLEASQSPVSAWLVFSLMCRVLVFNRKLSSGDYIRFAGCGLLAKPRQDLSVLLGCNHGRTLFLAHQFCGVSRPDICLVYARSVHDLVTTSRSWVAMARCGPSSLFGAIHSSCSPCYSALESPTRSLTGSVSVPSLICHIRWRAIRPVCAGSLLDTGTSPRLHSLSPS